MATITKSDELRLYNRGRILKCLRDNGRQSRTWLGENTGLSAATVTQVTADLIDDGVIKQVTPTAVIAPTTINIPRRGRPQVLLELSPDAATTAVLTFLLNEIEVSLYDYSGDRLHKMKKRIVTAKLSAASLAKHVYAILDRALATDALYPSSLKHITLVCQGTVSSDNSGLLWSPITQISNFDFRTKLQARYGVGVTVSNDCNTIVTALYFERLKLSANNDAEKDDSNSKLKDKQSARLIDTESNFGAILSSYGIGLGFFHQGSVLTGSHSSGTEFGHMLYRADGALCRCGRFGCIEAYAADYAIWRRAKQLPADTVPVDSIPADEFAQMIDSAQHDDGPERAAFEEAGAAIGQGLTNLFAIFDPFPALLVGTSSSVFDLMEKSLSKNLRHYGMGDSSDYICVYDGFDENDLIRNGASLQALSYIDEQIFGFGEKTSGVETPAAS